MNKIIGFPASDKIKTHVPQVRQGRLYLLTMTAGEAGVTVGDGIVPGEAGAAVYHNVDPHRNMVRMRHSSFCEKLNH